MQFNKFKFLSLCLIVLFVALGTIYLPKALAVSLSSINVNIAPLNPAPHQNVTITLSSFAVSLDNVTITWLVDGKTILSGIGKKSLSITTKAVNSETRIEARIFLPDGEKSKKIVIRPSVMVLLWQANDSYVPPFYKGKALPTADSEIKVVAMPEIMLNNKIVNHKNMTYSWKLDYNNMQSASGYGKNFFTYINDYLENSSTISVIVNTTNQQYKSESSTRITTINPEISFYKKDTNMGILWEQALSNGYIIQGEEIIIAEPYFISPKNWRKPELLFYWNIGNRSIPTSLFTKNSVPLKATEGVSGTLKLKLEIENTNKIFQTAKKEINIRF